MIDFRLVGALGIILISAGVIIKRRKDQNFLYILGGFCLGIYSIYINDLIFLILQIIFISSATYDFIKVKKQLWKKQQKER